MKISTKGRYGLRILIDIAQKSGDNPRLIREIAESQGISEKYVANLILKLKKQGMLVSTLGVHGGYSLNKSPKEITLLEIFEAMEGRLSILRCIECPNSCKKAKVCKARMAWRGINKKIAKILEDTTLAEIMNE